ncbi:NADH-quinone oxidoreductase subunit N [Paenibacillus sp.]|uniref:NADH-quinone oxidoreductase subunit N n=1 Tax=Paenibacillus sp. TaxID=58172 RepID=UPI002D73B34D|nr:NADH-quinone oxidoreductase subunit N [Paenibacillus sp.]HZG87355.1 NADH-quinone oxidoreductase subunit N [Paenibacillus sp.]
MEPTESLLRLKVADLAHLAPELTLVIAAVVFSLLDLALPRSASRTAIGWLTLAALAASAVFAALQLGVEQPIALLNQSYRVDDFALVMKLLFLAGAALSILISLGMRKDDLAGDDVGEYYYFYLPATLGAMIVASSADLIMLFVGIELLSITTYIMVGMRKKLSVSTEAAFKYIVMGGISSAFLLYGMSFLYGLSGSTNLLEINMALRTGGIESFSALLYVSFFLMLTGLGFKIAAAPFHAWAPDVYQGAATPVAAYLAVVSKAAGFAMLFRLFYTAFFQTGSTEAPLHQDMFLALAVLAAAAMVIGNAMALRQQNAKRLLALSGVANAGYLLVPIAADVALFRVSGFSELVYYMIAYLFMNMGAFAAIAIVSRTEGHDELRGFAGLYHRAPWTAFAIVLIVLSLAGIPVTGGFFGKLFILLGAIEMKLFWLALLMIATSVISFYYYFGFIRQMFMRPGAEETPIKVPPVLGTALWLSAAAGVLMGFFPGPLLGWLEGLFRFTTDFFI